MKLVLRPDARADVMAGSEYYEEASQDLAGDFVEELDRLLARLSEFPRSAQEVQGYPAVRRALMRRFPFAIFYTADEDVLLVLRVIHTSRSPQTWPEDEGISRSAPRASADGQQGATDDRRDMPGGHPA